MAEKVVSQNGLLYFFQKLKEIFVRKEDGKGLSSNDFTTDEKLKLMNIEAGANKTIVTDSLISTSPDNALSANQGKILDEKINAINSNIGSLGGGDMMKAAYDTDNNGKVDNADNADKFGGQLPAYYATATEVKEKANEADLAAVATTGSYNDLTDKPTNFAPSSHTHQQSEVVGLEDAIGTMTEIAQGKCNAKVFDTVDELDAWIANSTNTANLKTGDVFYIRAVEVPDYWWDAETGTKQVLETTKVEIEYVTNAEIDEIIAS